MACIYMDYMDSDWFFQLRSFSASIKDEVLEEEFVPSVLFLPGTINAWSFQLRLWTDYISISLIKAPCPTYVHAVYRLAIYQ